MKEQTTTEVCLVHTYVQKFSKCNIALFDLLLCCALLVHVFLSGERVP